MSRTPDPPSESQPPEGISLDELTEAFAKAIGAQPRTPSEESAEQETIELTEVPPPGEPPEMKTALAEDDIDPCEISPGTILEAMLFVGNRQSRPLSATRAAELMRGVEPEEIAVLVAELNGRYAANGCPYQIIQEGEGYRLTLRKAFYPLRNRFYGRLREARLSQAAIDVLAIIAYQQPLGGEQISRLRGKPSGHVLSQLVRRGLLRIEREPTKRRTAQYFTTDRFLKLFGLESLDDLPQSEELGRR